MILQDNELIKEAKEFLFFFFTYIKDKIIFFGVRFEKSKDVIVAFLIVKRGKYSQSFLNTSFLVLVSASMIGGPIIAENNPFINEYFSDSPQEQATFEADIYSQPFRTDYSKKPRDTFFYEVKDGETLASISNKFDISVDTIKWANNLTSDVIKPKEKLKILPVTGVAHTVKPGDNIYAIAKKYKVDAQQILNWQFNDFADLDTYALEVDTVIIVPDGVIETAPASPRRRAVPKFYATRPGGGRFIWPTNGSISQYPIWYHLALDISNRSLPPVVAADTGTVAYIAQLRYGYGNHIIIDHGDGYKTLYAHLSQINVSMGQSVSQGQVIGVVGSTGRSTGPHLHFEVRVGDRLVDPLGYLK